MSPNEMQTYTTDYDPRPEHAKDIRTCSANWTSLEQSLLAWNMGIELGRAPTEKEVNIRLVNEILSTGNSHSKRCRAFCYLAHPDWFKEKQQEQ